MSQRFGISDFCNQTFKSHMLNKAFLANFSYIAEYVVTVTVIYHYH